MLSVGLWNWIDEGGVAYRRNEKLAAVAVFSGVLRSVSRIGVW